MEHLGVISITPVCGQIGDGLSLFAAWYEDTAATVWLGIDSLEDPEPFHTLSSSNSLSLCAGLYVHRSWWKLLFTFGQAVSSQFVAHFASWPMSSAGELPFCRDLFGLPKNTRCQCQVSPVKSSWVAPCRTCPSCNMGMAQPRYKVGQNLQLKPGDTCYDISYDSGTFTLPSQTSPSGVWPVPNSGRRLVKTSLWDGEGFGTMLAFPPERLTIAKDC